MKRFVAGLVLCGLVSGLSMAGAAQAGKVGGAGSAAGSSVALEKTEWKLVRLGDVPVKVEEPAPAASTCFRCGVASGERVGRVQPDYGWV